MNRLSRVSISALVLAAFAIPVSARIVLYPESDFHGPSLALDNAAGRSGRVELNAGNRAASLIVEGDPWLACESPSYGGRCVILPRGAYQTPAAMGLEHRVASLRLAEIGPDHDRPLGLRRDYER
jgi:Beta/Gamma crystallin